MSIRKFCLEHSSIYTKSIYVYLVRPPKIIAHPATKPTVAKARPTPRAISSGTEYSGVLAASKFTNG